MDFATIRNPKFKIENAFTLVEMLVSMAVLALLVSLVAQLFNSAALTISSSRKHIDADSQARALFDRIAIDLSRMVKRKDVDCIVKGWFSDEPTSLAAMPGNDAVFFFSEAPGYTVSALSGSSNAPKRSSVTLVGYRVNPSNTVSAYALERVGDILGWDPISGAGSIMFLTYAAGSTTPTNGSSIGTGWSSTVGTAANNYTDGTSSNYQAIGDQVIRFEYCYLLKGQTVGGTLYPAIFSLTPWDTRTPGPNHASINGLQDVAAIVVAVAILDPTSRKIVNNSNIGGLVTALRDPTPADLASSPPRLMAQTWNAIINTPSFGNNLNPPIPQLAAGQIRIYQRFFYLNPVSQ